MMSAITPNVGNTTQLTLLSILIIADIMSKHIPIIIKYIYTPYLIRIMYGRPKRTRTPITPTAKECPIQLNDRANYSYCRTVGTEPINGSQYLNV